MDKIAGSETNSEKSDRKRLLHGRGGAFEGLSFVNVDLYPPAFLVTLYEERTTEWKEKLSNRILELFPLCPVVIQDRTSAPWTNSFSGPDLPEPHIVLESGLLFRVSLRRGENPGLFPDMSGGRELVRSLAAGKKVLNLFAYTCAFSVAALAGGALSVLNLDMNRNSLSRGRENHRINNQNLSKVGFLDHNILKSFGKINREGPFDLVIIDPPPSQGGSFQLERDYGKILRKTPEFLAPDGLVLACLNSPRYDFSWFRNFLGENLGDNAVLEEREGGEDCPEANRGGGLKIILCRKI